MIINSANKKLKIGINSMDDIQLLKDSNFDFKNMQLIEIKNGFYYFDNGMFIYKDILNELIKRGIYVNIK